MGGCRSRQRITQSNSKEASTQYDKEKLFHYCVAIANEGGGHFVLGIRDGKLPRVVGSLAVRDPMKMEEKFKSEVTRNITVRTNPFGIKHFLY